jgi:predicted kinase
MSSATNPKAYILVGVPGSGKSTWVKSQTWLDGAQVISTDTHVESYARSQGKTYTEVFKDYMPTALEMMVNEVVLARHVNRDIIWDQTSTTISTRAKKIRMLPNYYKIAIIFKTPPTSELMERLASRPGKEVPWEVVSTMAQQLETEPPTLEEGFDEIWMT